MHALALERLAPVLALACAHRASRPAACPPPCALDVGSGSGYLLACIARLMSTPGTGGGLLPGGSRPPPDDGDRGHVWGVEHVAELAAASRAALARDAQPADDFAHCARVTVVVGDGRLGLPERAPFDVIHVGAACGSADVTEALQRQLRWPGGVLLLPVGPPDGGGPQELVQVTRLAEGRWAREALCGVRYIPLCDAGEQRRRAAAAACRNGRGDR